MPLTLRLFSTPALRTGMSYAVMTGNVMIGTITQRPNAPYAGLWEWSMQAPRPDKTAMECSGTAETLDDAKDAFGSAWQAWLAVAELQERPGAQTPPGRPI